MAEDTAMNNHAAGCGIGTKGNATRPQNDDPATTAAVSSIASPPADDFSSAFQVAWRKPAPRTASVMPAVSPDGSTTRYGVCAWDSGASPQPHPASGRLRKAPPP